MEIRNLLSEYRLTAIVIGLMCFLGLTAHHIVRADAAFSHAYYQYAVDADDADTAVYIPTANNNPVRLELNSILKQVLVAKLSDAERLEKAKRGLELLKASQAQVEGITPKLEAVQASIGAMKKSVGFGDALFQRGDPQKIIALAKERAAASSDIRALSFRANFETEKIFQHLVESEGRLSSVYMQELNNELPAEQDSFDERQKRYSILPGNFDSIQAAYADFSSITKRSGN